MGVRGGEAKVMSNRIKYDNFGIFKGFVENNKKNIVHYQTNPFSYMTWRRCVSNSAATLGMRTYNRQYMNLKKIHLKR